jgi:serine/threonine-protein kinase
VTEAEPPAPGTSNRTRLERRPLVLVDEVLDGKYRVLRPLQRGSMGAVFAAENLRLGLPVAVKVIRSDLDASAKAEIAERMVQEAHAAFLVDHPAIVRVLDVGTTPHGDPYVVMELLRGKTLGAALADHGPVDATQAVRVLMPIADALVAAHTCGVIHRDVKPNNVFLARTGDGRIQPKLIDFGLARAVQSSASRITRLGNTMGSPSYMAPEQIRGEDVTALADVWGFCIMLYEMIIGDPPFRADELDVLFTHILSDPPTSFRDLAMPDDELWAIVERGLAKDQADRWPSMRKLGAALAYWLVCRGHVDDVCGTALGSVWLEPGRTAGKVDVLAPRPIAKPRTKSRGSRRSFSDMSTGRWRPMRLRRRRWLAPAIAALVAAGVAAAASAYLRLRLPELPERWKSYLPWRSPEPLPSALPDAGWDAAADAAAEAGLAEGEDAAFDAAFEEGPDAAFEEGLDRASEKGPDALPESDAASRAAAEAPADAAADAATEAARP